MMECPSTLIITSNDDLDNETTTITTTTTTSPIDHQLGPGFNDDNASSSNSYLPDLLPLQEHQHSHTLPGIETLSKDGGRSFLPSTSILNTQQQHDSVSSMLEILQPIKEEDLKGILPPKKSNFFLIIYICAFIFLCIN